MKLQWKSLFLLLLMTGYPWQASFAQSVTENTFGKGIKTIAKDSSFYLKFSTRIQNRYEATYVDQDKDRFEDRFYLRRARLKFDGFVFSPKVVYKIEYDLVNSIILDAVVKWNVYKNLSIWYGQTKLPGNVERVISSQKLQFVDRSLLNSAYNIDRDKGIQIRHYFTLGNVLIREIIAVSQGEGMNFKEQNNGEDYTGRIELLPFGKFTGKGDYFSSDLKREPTPKLMIGVTYGFNDDAIREKGQRGAVLPGKRDLQTFLTDLVFKYSGVSVMAEYVDRSTGDESPAIWDAANREFLGSFYTGTGFNGQLGYLFKNNWELAGRYTEIAPFRYTGIASSVAKLNNEIIKQYTFGVSKYIVGHSLKIQSDVTYTEEEDKNDAYGYRLQVELSF